MTSLTLRRDYLGLHRRLAVGRSLAAAAVGLVPIPLLDDWLMEATLGGAYKRIAAAHQIDLDPTALKNLVHGKTQPRPWYEMTGTALAGRLAGKGLKRFLVALTAVRRAQAAARTFTTLTVFDHYCARVHTGLGLDGARALEVRELIRRALMETPGGMAFEPFRKGALAAARTVARAPLALADVASGGRLRKLLSRGKDVEEAEAVDEVDAIVEHELAETNGVLARAVAAIELQLTAEVNPYIDQVIERFDTLWRARLEPT
jgi:uncharacterized protein (DUF697 family)